MEKNWRDTPSATLTQAHECFRNILVVCVIHVYSLPSMYIMLYLRRENLSAMKHSIELCLL